MLAAALARRAARRRSAAIVELGDQGLQPRQVLRRHVAPLGEVADERCELAAEHPVEEALALCGDVLIARDQRAVADPALVAEGLDRFLLKEPPDQRLDGGVAPLRARDLGDDLLDHEGSAPPEPVHDPAFRAADPHRSTRSLDTLATSVVLSKPQA